MRKKKENNYKYIFFGIFLFLLIIIFSRGFTDTIDSYKYVKEHYNLTIEEKKKLEKQVKEIEYIEYMLKNSDILENDQNNYPAKLYRIDVRGENTTEKEENIPFEDTGDIEIRVISQ